MFYSMHKLFRKRNHSVQVSSMISSFRREVDENCALLGYYASGSVNLIPLSGTTYPSDFQGSIPEDRKDKLSRTVS